MTRMSEWLNEITPTLFDSTAATRINPSLLTIDKTFDDGQKKLMPPSRCHTISYLVLHRFFCFVRRIHGRSFVLLRDFRHDQNTLFFLSTTTAVTISACNAIDSVPSTPTMAATR